MNTAANNIVRALFVGDLRELSPADLLLFSRLGLSQLFSAGALCMTLPLGLAALTARKISARYRPKDIFALNVQQFLFFAFALLLMCLYATATDWKTAALRPILLVGLGFAYQAAGLYVPRVAKAASVMGFMLCFCKLSFTFFLLVTLAYAGTLLAQKKSSLFLWPWLASNIAAVFLFHQFSWLTPLSIPLIAPLLQLTVVLPAFIAHLIGLIGCDYLQTLLQAGAAKMMGLWIPCLQFLASPAWLSLWVPHTKLVIIFAVLSSAWFGARRIQIVIRICLTLCAGVLLQTFWPAPLGAAILNVGQGDSILLWSKETAGPFLVDLGPASHANPYPAPSSSNLEDMGIDELSGVLISHPDWDHYGGTSTVFARHQTKKLWLAKSLLQFPKTEAILAAAEVAQVPVQLIDRRDIPYPGLECLARQNPPRSTNENCPLCKYQLASGKTLLLTGDMGENSENHWRESNPDFVAANYLKIGHHGSSGSTSAEFLAAVNPELALISVGARNRYGHPKADILERLEASHIAIRRTDKNGTLWLK